MANIVLTNVCNLNCPYCFASELRSGPAAFISAEALEQIVIFLQRSYAREVGIIGGEPTLHPRFAEITENLANSGQFRKVFVYSNGLALSRFFPRLLRSDICYLVNVNSPDVIGEQRFQQIQQTLDAAAGYDRLRQFSLGLNIYTQDQDFSAVLDLCTEYDFTALRLSVVVPPNADKIDRFAYFMRLKPTLLALYREMKERNLVPKYDCNVVPPCVFSEEELAFCASMPGAPEDIRKITGANAVCRPVIDIYPDLSVSRCFGMSATQRCHLSDFETLEDLIRYYLFHVDGSRLYSDSCSNCTNCYQRNVLRCYGGCLAFI